MTDEFGVLIHAMGEWTVGRLGSLGLNRLSIYGDSATGSARMFIGLENDGWEERRAVIDALIEIRLMYLDEISLEFSFADDEPHVSAQATPAYQYA